MKKLLASLAFICLAVTLIGAAAANINWSNSGLQAVFLPVLRSSVPSSAPVVSTPSPQPSATSGRIPEPKTIVGLAVLGDSGQDEYRADNQRGGAYGETTFNWVELLASVRHINLGEWGTRDEPRRSGYAFNWARTGATSDQMIIAGQHTGIAEQVLAGQVSHAVIQIGANDFASDDLTIPIYDGSLSGAALEARLNQIVDNIITAARTLKQTNRCQVLVAATQDYYITLHMLPELQQRFPDPVGQQRSVDAMTYLNQQIAARSAQEGVAFFDFNAAYLAEINNRLDAEGFLVVGGERINLQVRGDEPHFGLLDDQYVHSGTVLSGLTAKVYIEAFNRFFQTGITPLSDDEILRAAGINP